jgi:hypothetical protein
MEWLDIVQIAFTSGIVSAIVSGVISFFSVRKVEEEEERVYDRIQKTYFEEGITQIVNAVSVYGTSIVFALVDLKTWIHRSSISDNKHQILKSKINEIRGRTSISELINHDLTLAIKWFPKLQRFGMPFYNALKRTFQVYGTFLADLTKFRLFIRTNRQQ